MDFYKLIIPSFNQHKFAWAETYEPNISDHYDKCPECKRAISMLYHVPPFNIVIKQPKKIGDFLNGNKPSDLIVSERFRNEYDKSDLKGIREFYELNVVKVGSKRNKDYSGSKFFGAMVSRPFTKVDYKTMGVDWDNKPQNGYCKFCGPGGGGKGGTLKSYDRISVIEKTWDGLDFFIPINFAGNIIITKKAKDFIESNDFQNCQIIPVENAHYDFYNPQKNKWPAHNNV